MFLTFSLNFIVCGSFILLFDIFLKRDGVGESILFGCKNEKNSFGVSCFAILRV